ncbi:calcium-binding protein [Sulfitobacter sp. JL08]|uniref:EF-hand domain-containing protein n=1 Tax=Sulfitobacter sp. JL08 TaxID=2070369 RepID=UPI000E0AF636|nr:EF-hand domain-containing protein [Sulfitobacter sp. JL08]AXI55585.1 calcium-binding protein [Sulfitobacter sp. JL08]
MKRTAFITGIILAGFSVTALASVAVAKGQRGHHMTFSQIDTDGNGQITREEMQSIVENRFAAADADADGFLTRAELEKAAAERAKERVTQMMERMDTDRDGKITLAEMKPRRDPSRMFDRVDSDSDGVISQAEFDAFHAQRKGRHSDKQD